MVQEFEFQSRILAKGLQLLLKETNNNLIFSKWRVKRSGWVKSGGISTSECDWRWCDREKFHFQPKRCRCRYLVFIPPQYTVWVIFCQTDVMCRLGQNLFCREMCSMILFDIWWPKPKFSNDSNHFEKRSVTCTVETLSSGWVWSLRFWVQWISVGKPCDYNLKYFYFFSRA